MKRGNYSADSVIKYKVDRGIYLLIASSQWSAYVNVYAFNGSTLTKTNLITGEVDRQTESDGTIVIADKGGANVDYLFAKIMTFSS